MECLIVLVISSFGIASAFRLFGLLVTSTISSLTCNVLQYATCWCKSFTKIANIH